MAEIKKAESVGKNQTPKTSNPFDAQVKGTKFNGGESVGKNPVPATQNPFKDKPIKKPEPVK